MGDRCSSLGATYSLLGISSLSVIAVLLLALSLAEPDVGLALLHRDEAGCRLLRDLSLSDQGDELGLVDLPVGDAVPELDAYCLAQTVFVDLGGLGLHVGGPLDLVAFSERDGLLSCCPEALCEFLFSQLQLTDRLIRSLLGFDVPGESSGSPCGDPHETDATFPSLACA